jgi:hypothetical protein
MPAFAIPRTWPASRRFIVDTGKIEELKDIKGPALYYVTSLAWDPRGRKLYYTTDNNDCAI